MDESKERVDALKKCKKLCKLWFKLSPKSYQDFIETGLPRIDQHLVILKEKECKVVNMNNIFGYWAFNLITKQSIHKDFEASTLERALDKAVNWVLTKEK